MGVSGGNLTKPHLLELKGVIFMRQAESSALTAPHGRAAKSSASSPPTSLLRTAVRIAEHANDRPTLYVAADELRAQMLREMLLALLPDT